MEDREGLLYSDSKDRHATWSEKKKKRFEDELSGKSKEVALHS